MSKKEKKSKEIRHIDLMKIESPMFLKELSYKELNVLSTDISKYIIDVTSRFGGHLSSNLGVIDATIALCRSFDFSKDKIVFDVGHQSYTYKLLTGRSLEGIRQKNGISGFQRMDESPYDHFEAGHSSTSISVISGLAASRDLHHENYQTVAFIGDASIANGLAMEALNVGSENKHKFIVVVNDNDMSISHPVGGFAKMFRKLSTSNFYRKSKHFYKRVMTATWLGRKIYSLTSRMKNWFKHRVLKNDIFDALGGYSVIGPIDGHNIKAMEKAFEKAKKADKSTIVIIKTIKGKGYKYAEEDIEGAWHGVGKFDVESGTKNKSSRTYWSEIYSDLISNKLKEDPNSVCIVPATGLGSNLNKTFKEYPDQCYDVGIAEEHAVTYSAGMAVGGLHPIVAIYSSFLQRAYDELLHDICHTNKDSTFIVDRAGLVGNDGSSHQGIFDEYFLLGMPNTVVCMPSNIHQAKSLFDESYLGHGPFFIRCPREKIFVECDKEENLEFGKWKKEFTGHKVAIVSVGPETELLKEIIKDKDVTLYNAIYLKPMDEEAIKDLLTYDKVIIYDAYAIENGFPEHLAASLIKQGYKGRLIIKAIPNTFVHHASVYEQKQEYKLLPEDILELL